MKKNRSFFAACCVAFLASAFLAACGQSGSASRESVEEFYRGNTIRIIVAGSPGGGYDVLSRLLARYMPKHIPGHPQIIIQNMQGGGSLLAANYVFNVAPKDGTVMGIYFDTVPLAPLLKFEGAKFDPLKVGWLGSLAKRDQTLVVVRSDAPATTFEGAKKTVVTLGSAGPNSATATYPLLLNELLGTKFKIIVGYPGEPETMLAMERGEVDGRAGTSWAQMKHDYPEKVAKGEIVPMIQLSLNPIPGLDHVPRAMDMAKSEQDLQVMKVVLGNQEFSRVYSVAEGVPEERLAALRTALEATANDPEFKKEAAVSMTDTLGFSRHEALEAFLKESYSLPKEIQDRAARYVGGG
jgi:tripartite-type tricarboxylate transporter receptor subunit TctC